MEHRCPAGGLGTLGAVERYDDVDAYLGDAKRWPGEIRALRPLLLDCGLDEQIKWGKPCYVHDGANICIVQEMKGFLALMFFKGALLDDPDGVLEAQGPSSRSAMRIRFTSTNDVVRLSDAVRTCVAAAIAVEEAGLEVSPAPEPDLADELREALARDPALAAAFDGLTRGRRREVNLHIAGAKQAATRQTRVERCIPMILAGKGMRDR